MRVGLISDTHGLLRPEVKAAFAGVDRILHAGDVGRTEVLAGLEEVAPVVAVRGNADARLAPELPPVARIELAGVTVLVVHGDALVPASAAAVVAAHPGAGLVVFGHSHRPSVERIGTALAVNPGSAGRRRFHLPVTVALAELDRGRVRAWLLELGPAGFTPYASG